MLDLHHGGGPLGGCGRLCVLDRTLAELALFKQPGEELLKAPIALVGGGGGAMVEKVCTQASTCSRRIRSGLVGHPTNDVTRGRTSPTLILVTCVDRSCSMAPFSSWVDTRKKSYALKAVRHWQKGRLRGQ
jgi:hypothetical protein